MLYNSFVKPLAFLIRPKNLDEFVGQKHLVGEGKPLRVAIEHKYKWLWGVIITYY